VGQNKILLTHFFRRFFDNDTLQVEGDTTTTIARALAAVTAPGLLVAFFLQNQYPARSLWGRVEDQYFFVLLSFVVMGAVTLFEWEMLFPDRIDFLVLTPLPLRKGQLMTAKAGALAGFLLVFLAGSNCLGALVYALISHEHFARQVFAHVVAVALAGIFSCCAVLTLVGLLRCFLPDWLFRPAAPLLQALLTAILALSVIQYARYPSLLEGLLSNPKVACWIPPFWFQGVYDHLLYGSSAPAFAQTLSTIGVRACIASLLSVLLLYPLAWARMHKMSIEGSVAKPGAPSSAIAGLLHFFVRRPQERAMFHFLGQTIRRSPRYQIYLSMYAGTGLSLAAACAFALHKTKSGVTLADSVFGLHAVVPLLIFWAIAGLRTAFAFPVSLSSRWIFRVSGADARESVAAAARWTLLLATLVWTVSLACLSGGSWSARAVLVQITAGICLAVLIRDAFFLSRRVPLIQPRLPGRTNFALFLTLYLGVLTPAIYGVIWSELRIEQSPRLVLPLLLITLGVHAAFLSLQGRPMEQEELMEGYDDVFQMLHLS
jgi:hypothetical protein